jgi:hypothetical protein
MANLFLIINHLENNHQLIINHLIFHVYQLIIFTPKKSSRRDSVMAIYRHGLWEPPSEV